MTLGQMLLVVAVVLALVLGLWRLRSDGRFSSRPAGTVEQARRVPTSATTPGTAAGEEAASEVVGAANVLEGTSFVDQLGGRATLLQFSTAFCAPCKVTRRTLSEVAEVVPGVVHLEVDAEDNLDLVRRLKVMRTPTTLVLDGRGVEVSRAGGAPRKEQVVAALAAAVED